MWDSHLLHLTSDDGRCRARVPSFDSPPAQYPLDRSYYVRVNHFLDPEVAENAYRELMEDPRYMRPDRGRGAPGSAGYQFGTLKSIDNTLSPGVQMCCDLLTGADFRNWLRRLCGVPLQLTRRPALFRMERGDRIEKHDDVSGNPLNRASVVLHLSKNWKRELGGNTVVGEVRRIETVQLGEYLGQRWVFSSRRSVLVPGFNSLTVIALKPGIAHSVTSVHAEACRLSIVCLYGAQTESAASPVSR